MKRSLAPLALLCAASAASGCVQNDLSMTVIGFSVISSAAGVCSGSAQSTSLISLGVYDVGVPENFGYICSPIVQNNLVVSGTTTTVERNTIHIQGFEIELHPEGGGNFPNGLSNSFKTTVGAAAATPAGGRQSVIVEAFPRSVAVNQLAPLIGSKWDGKLLIKMRPYGDISGNPITGGWATLPIKLCNGCLTGGIQACPPGGYPTASILAGNPCYPAQDADITCCSQGDTIRCGNNAPTGSGADAGL
jgi:hypothetical protein